MRFASPRRRAHTSLRATGRFGAFSTISALAAALALGIPSAATAFDAPVSASWHGRAIQDPQPSGDVAITAASLPRGWSAGPVQLGTGFQRAEGSKRVREVQQRLWRLGYRPGPVDGRFGPRTQAAVAWFQVKHGIEPDGVVGLQTLGLLRERTSAAPRPGVTQEPVRDVREGARGAAPQPQPATQSADRGQKPAGGRDGGGSLLPLLLLLAVPAALALNALRRGGRPKVQPAEPPTAVPNAAAPPAPESTAIGYVRAAAGDRTELARHAGAIRRACTEHGWRVTELVCDDQHATARRAFERPGLAAAMERLAGVGGSRLVVSKLGHLSRSQADLTALFEWFDRNDVQVIAIDVGLDTTTPRGRAAAHAQLADFSGRQARAHSNGHNGGAKKVTVDSSSVRA
jgi:peptidoglycan hydrolase-like protein with peptidoglycan-binding domain